MNIHKTLGAAVALTVMLHSSAATPKSPEESLSINDQEYLEMTGLERDAGARFLSRRPPGRRRCDPERPEGRHHGDLRLDPTPGQWQPTPAVGPRQVDRAANEISVRMSYPDEKIDRKGNNPIGYPDLKFSYVNQDQAGRIGFQDYRGPGRTTARRVGWAGRISTSNSIRESSSGNPSRSAVNEASSPSSQWSGRLDRRRL